MKDEINSKNLKSCMSHRNSHSWFIHCKKVCNKFSIGEFVEYFEPEIRRIRIYNKFIKERLVKSHIGAPANLILQRKRVLPATLGTAKEFAHITEEGVKEKQVQKKERKLTD